jgi:hypothetical protein
MRKKLIFILLTFVLAFNLFAYTTVKQVGKISIRVGTSSRNIMPFLEKVATEWSKYFESIYAEYHENKIFINIKASGLYLTFDEIYNVSCAVVDEAMRNYPLSDIQILVLANPSDRAWHKLKWTIQTGKITGYEEE